jgi:transposase
VAGAEPDRPLPPVASTPVSRPMSDNASGRLFNVSADLVPDNLWERIAALLPARPARRHPHPGRLPVSDRVALAGIVYVLRKGVAWRDVPIQVVGCSGVTAWRRLRDWTEAGVWPRLHEVLLAELRVAGLLEMDDSAIDGSHVRALKGGLTLDLRRSTGAGWAASTT